MFKSVIKIILFAALVVSFVIYAHTWGKWPQVRQAVYSAYSKECVVFIVGAWLAIWGDQRIGVLDPISLRSIYIFIGVMLMILAVVLAQGLREVILHGTA